MSSGPSTCVLLAWCLYWCALPTALGFCSPLSSNGLVSSSRRSTAMHAEGALRTNPLGSSDIVVPEVCLGTMTWGQQNSEEEAVEQLDYAMERGLNFFDTAEIYPVPPRKETQGHTEDFMGRWLAKQDRSKVTIASKVTGYIGMPSFNYCYERRPGFDPAKPPEVEMSDRKSFLNACEGSLQRLQTDYIDLYQIHWPARYSALFDQPSYDYDKEREGMTSFDEQVAAMGELHAQGKIKAWGVSNENAYGVAMMSEAAKRLGVPPPVSIQNDYSLVQRQFEDTGTAEACSALHCNLGLLAYGAMAGGFLSGKYLPSSGKKVGEGKRGRHDLYPQFQPRYYNEASTEACIQYAELAAELGISTAQLALAWTGATNPFVASTIIGATSIEQLKENIDAFSVKLEPEVLQKIDAIHAQNRRPCQTTPKGRAVSKPIAFGTD